MRNSKQVPEKCPTAFRSEPALKQRSKQTKLWPANASLLRVMPGLLAIPLFLSGCALPSPLARATVASPFSDLRLVACRDYRNNIVECQLEYGTRFERYRLGPVQEVARDLSTDLDNAWYQISSCTPAPRVQRQLPNFVCRIHSWRSGSDAGSVLIKGGTAVRLARILGDRDQLRYQWAPDPWSRVRD